MVKPDTLYKIATLLIKVPNIEAVKAICVSELKLDPAAVEGIVQEARVLLTRAADFHRDEEFGAAVTALKDLYASNVKIKAYKDALPVRKELNRLLGLYGNIDDLPAEQAGMSPEERELAEIRGHLEPLGLAPSGSPLVELARLAAIEITNR